MLIFNPAIAALVAAAFRAFSDKLLMELLELRKPSTRPEPGVLGLPWPVSSLLPFPFARFRLSAGRVVLFVAFWCIFFSVPLSKVKVPASERPFSSSSSKSSPSTTAQKVVLE